MVQNEVERGFSMKTTTTNTLGNQHESAGPSMGCSRHALAAGAWWNVSSGSNGREGWATNDRERVELMATQRQACYRAGDEVVDSQCGSCVGCVQR